MMTGGVSASRRSPSPERDVPDTGRAWVADPTSPVRPHVGEIEAGSDQHRQNGEWFKVRWEGAIKIPDIPYSYLGGMEGSRGYCYGMDLASVVTFDSRREYNEGDTKIFHDDISLVGKKLQTIYEELTQMRIESVLSLPREISRLRDQMNEGIARLPRERMEGISHELGIDDPDEATRTGQIHELETQLRGIDDLEAQLRGLEEKTDPASEGQKKELSESLAPLHEKQALYRDFRALEQESEQILAEVSILQDRIEAVAKRKTEITEIISTADVLPAHVLTTLGIGPEERFPEEEAAEERTIFSELTRVIDLKLPPDLIGESYFRIQLSGEAGPHTVWLKVEREPEGMEISVISDLMHNGVMSFRGPAVESFRDFTIDRIPGDPESSTSFGVFMTDLYESCYQPVYDSYEVFAHNKLGPVTIEELKASF